MNISSSSSFTSAARQLVRLAILLVLSSSLLTLRAGADTSAWKDDQQPDLAAFDHWAQHPTAATIDEGVRLARNRQAALLKLMHTDPARVIAAGVPDAVRAKLPARVVSELETSFSAVGDYTDYCELRAIAGANVKPSRQEIKFGGHVYPAHVYGRRVGLTTKRHIFLHGVLLGGEAVLDENVLRALPADEAARDPRTPRDLSALAGGTAASASTSGPVLAEAGGALYRFASDAQLSAAETLLRAIEAHRTPETAAISEPAALENPASVPPTPDSAYTTGNKGLLVIRVDFSDLTGDPSFYGTADTAAVCQNIADSQVAPYYVRSSYGLTSLTTTVTSQVYRMPRTASSYATAGDNDGLHADAETAASADYNVSGYDRVLVLFSYLGNLSGSQITYGGLSQVGGEELWVNGEFDFRVVAHELGHTYGLIHGNLWQVSDGNPASLGGTSVEYGDDYDTMGANFANTQDTDFNVWFKTQLDWVPLAQVQRVTTSGTYRVNRFDGGSDNGTMALEVVKDGTRNYWVSIRRNFTSNTSMTHGVYVTWGYNSDNIQDALLDMQTPGNSDSDAALPTGTTFTDTAAGISITPLDEGGTSPNEYEDVRINVDTTGSAPVINSANTAGATVGTAFSYQITATNSPTSYAASGLPAGLSVDASTGMISGSPTADGTFSMVVSALNGGGIGSRTVSVSIGQSANAPTISSFSPTSGAVGTTVVINGTGFVPPLSIVFSGNVSAAGSFTSTKITVTVPSGAITGPITVNTSNGSVSTATNFTIAAAGVPAITSATTATGTQGTAFSYQIVATNSPTSYGVQGLPAGFTVNTSTGLITGTSKGAGQVALTLNAYNNFGKGSATLTLTIKAAPPVITSATTATATQGTAFSYQIAASNSPTSFGVQGLPTGLTVNTKTGLISGTSKGAGKVTLTLNAYNAAGKGSASLTLTVKAAPPVITSATTATATVGTAFSYQIVATNSATSFGVQGLPAGFSVNTTTGVITATPKAAGTVNLTLNAYNAAGKGSAALTVTVAH